MSNELLLAVAGNAAGAGEATYVEDVFSTYLYTGNSGIQHIENGIALSDANSGGSLDFDGSSDYATLDLSSFTTIGTGDFTFECWVCDKNSQNGGIFGITD